MSTQNIKIRINSSVDNNTSPHIVDLSPKGVVPEQKQSQPKKAAGGQTKANCYAPNLLQQKFEIEKKQIAPMQGLPPGNKHHHVLGIISHILAWLLISGGILTVPLVGVWGYRTVTTKRGEVLGTTIKAVEELKEAEPKLREFDFIGAQTHLQNAYLNFAQAQESLNGLDTVIKALGPFIPKGKSYYNVSQVGLLITKIGKLLTDPALLEKTPQNSRIAQLELLHAILQQIRPLLKEAKEKMELVNPEDFDEQYRVDIQKLYTGVTVFDANIDKIINTLQNVMLFLGNDTTKRYLLLFQNSGELRPTGGFIGSFALVDVYKGEVVKIIQPKGGTYDLHYGMTQALHAPSPFRVLNPRWEIQDCNWFPNFRFSAQKCAWFIESTYGTSVDGVIAINVEAVAELLKIIGPITLPDYNLTITSDNFIPTTQVTVARAHNTKEPKEFLVELFPALTERIFARMEEDKGIFDIAMFLVDSTAKKEVQLYSFDSNMQKWIEDNGGWNKQEVEATDYLHVNTATVNGGKSDFDIKQTIYYSVAEKDGHLIATVEITREHTGERYLPDAPVGDIERDFNYLTAQPNVSYIRLYTPLGSRLLSVEGDIFDPTPLIKDKPKLADAKDDDFLNMVEKNPVLHEESLTRITEEFDKTVFGNYLKVDPGGFGRLIFRYEIGNSAKPYSLAVQKQSGTMSRLIVDYMGEELYDGVLEKDLIVRR